MEEVAEAKPSMLGAVPTMALSRPVLKASSLQVSLMTPEPTPRIRSQLTSRRISTLPSIHSSGAGLSTGTTHSA